MTNNWETFYAAALFETDRTQLPNRIEAAQAAVDARFQQLSQGFPVTGVERRALVEAQLALIVLRAEARNGLPARAPRFCTATLGAAA